MWKIPWERLGKPRLEGSALEQKINILWRFRGGTSGGNCAAGFGVCCVVASTTCTSSGTSISNNNTYLRNPSYPSAYPTPTSATICAFTVNKMNDNICQLRLDFQTLELGQTAATGACTDTFQATASVESSVT